MEDFGMDQSDVQQEITCKDKIKQFCSNWFPRIIVVISLSITLAFSLLLFNNYYKDQTENTYSKIGFIIPWTLAMISFFRACMTNPGRVPLNIAQTAQASQQNECDYCDNLKPMRAHHCHISERCVLKMDHYCPWIGNCVGYGNYKYFYLLLVYVGIGGVYYIYSALSYLWLQRDIVAQGYQLTIFKGFLIAAGNIAILPTIIAVIYLNLFHTYLIYNNLTTIQSLYNYDTVVPIISFLCCNKRICKCNHK